MPDKRRLQRLEAAILETIAPLVAHGLSDPRLTMNRYTRAKLHDLGAAVDKLPQVGPAAQAGPAAPHPIHHRSEVGADTGAGATPAGMRRVFTADARYV